METSSLIGEAPEALGPTINPEVAATIGHNALIFAGYAAALLVGYWGVKMIATGKSPWAKSQYNSSYSMAA
ncbi:hypothetical protein KJ652_06950 [Patescibacteria group bacterium]|nr:hypothetical protein [Patescibacteria group bacterium]MBU1124287.1 hypothetical protein [Patescibacteria group bacterium]MBU1911533.1 hypothetical protein [Patescibacteria group bacterium]